MIERRLQAFVTEALGRQAAVAIIGPRQVGKTTLALQIAQQKPSIYLDLESREDRAKLDEPETYLRHYQNHLVVLDEIHRAPELFQTLRGLIDEVRRQGNRNGRFLILGSASVDLLRQSGESLAGRIEHVDLGPLNLLEVGGDVSTITRLWLRGGFPDSYLAKNDADSLRLRRSFVRTYLERDVREFGPRIPAETLERLWTMLAHNQSCLLNSSNLASGLQITAPTVNSYIGLLVDLLLVRRLPPVHANTGKRLIKSPKVYVRDSGLVHALLGIRDYNALCGHPVVGASWESFVLENLLAAAPEETTASFYRTAAGAEIDLVLDLPYGAGRWAIEIKRSLAGKAEKGFHLACEDLQPQRRILVHSGPDNFPGAHGIEAMSLPSLMASLAAL